MAVARGLARDPREETRQAEPRFLWPASQQQRGFTHKGAPEDCAVVPDSPGSRAMLSKVWS